MLRKGMLRRGMMRRGMMRRGFGLGLIAAATLTAEVALTRILSAGLFHHLAFVVVSTALFGTAAGGLAVVLGRPAPDPDRRAAFACLGFAAGLPALYALSQQVPLEPLKLLTEPVQAAWLGLVYLLLAAPFAAAGHAIAVILDRHAEHAPRLYGADLAGASLGCFVALGVLYAGPSGLYVPAALAVAAGMAFGLPARWSAAAAGAIVALAATVPLPLHISASKVTRAGEPFAAVLADRARTPRTTWGPLGRTDVVRFGAGQRRVVLDAGVAAVRLPTARTGQRASDVTLPYELRPKARVLIVGAGAGWEVAEALRFGASHVDAVEINPAVAREAPRWLREHPQVAWHLTDGRAFLHQGTTRYDAILMIHTISNAATAAGALRLAEDYLLTAEALTQMRRRLKNDGLLLITRPEAQLYPLLRNLYAAGAKPTEVWGWAEPAGGFYSAVLVRRGPWTEAESDTVRHRLSQRRLQGVLVPSSSSPEAEVLQYRVATDDRPYFHQHGGWSDLDLGALFGQHGRARAALEDRPLAEVSVLVLLAETTVMAAVVLLLPLLGDPRRRRAESLRVAVYFSALGLGFMLVEIALVQRLGLVLGSPTLAFAVVFAGLIGGTAAGSALSERFWRPRQAPAAALLVVAIAAALAPTVVAWTLPWPAVARAAMALLVVTGVGIPLGLPFPIGLKRLAGRPGTVAWAFAFNGVASVAGTSFAILIGAQSGLTVTLIVACALYGLAWAAMPESPR